MLRIAICPGHHEKARGAVNKKHSLNEHNEALRVVACMTPLLRGMGHEVGIFIGTLGSKIAQINAGEFDLALDIHFNAGGGRGCEVVYVPHSRTRREQARVISESIATYMNLKDRGPKEGWYQGGENPGTKPDAFVAQTNCPAFIPEPLFIDNDSEVEYWFVAGRHAQIAEAITLGISNSFGG